MRTPRWMDKARRVTCALFGHTLLRDHFFGYHCCCRCGQMLGDSLAGAYSDSSAVYVHHMHLAASGAQRTPNCHCSENAARLRRLDFFLVPQWNTFGFEQRPPWREKETNK